MQMSNAGVLGFDCGRGSTALPMHYLTLNFTEDEAEASERYAPWFGKVVSTYRKARGVWLQQQWKTEAWRQRIYRGARRGKHQLAIHGGRTIGRTEEFSAEFWVGGESVAAVSDFAVRKNCQGSTKSLETGRGQG